MSHHEHQDYQKHNDIKNIKTAFFLNFGFTIFEILGGIFTNSIAIVSDAVHDLGDSLSLALAWYFQKKSKKSSDKSYSYGYKRFSLLGAIFNSIILLVGSFIILYTAIPRLIHPEQPYVKGMFFFAIVGILVNGSALLQLKKGDSLNEKVVSLHMLEDVLGWAAILIGTIIMYFWKVPIVDAILSIMIAVFILYNVLKNLRKSLHIILQGIPYEVDSEVISQYLLTQEEVESIHDLHIWSIDGTYNILTVHIVLKQSTPMSKIALLKKKYRSGLTSLGIEHATIEFETSEEHCSMEQCVSE
ncbi:MAG TPA: cation diffusion facilitator family transporter [Paludibacteraceae bacterium]|nr:cation diffusion facilitator family transporter [Paludibacteraceae bacterium]HOL00953.1 cation diffusion facilitator family transporter [Paludibacteraceae bacterium]HPO67370.1 cation diffusion facilitator family transporter [Paludibacteraceae bacterium]